MANEKKNQETSSEEASSNDKDPNKDQGKTEKTISLKEPDHQKLLAELSEYKDKYLRLYAEFDNARKRMEREKLEFVKYANEELMSEFLNILDDLERSVEAAKAKHEDYSAFLKGIEMVMAHIYEMLKRHNVKPIESVGRKFDPHCHEALMLWEDDNAQEGTILEEFQKGYFIGDRVVRTAKVKVAQKNKNIEKEKEIEE